MNFTSSENDEENMRFAGLRHDQAAFESFFKKHYPALCVYCNCKYGFDIHLAEDVVNSSFMKLWETRHTLATDVSPKAYLYKIADNTSLNILKHEKVKRQHAQYLLQTSEGIEPAHFDNVDLKQLSSTINAAISDLPEQMRRIFELSRFEGLKYAQIADELNISVKTVETQMSRALAKLRQKLSGYLTLHIILFITGLLLKS
jgi:RNA polymerase sigma-70 factor (ECF subfamily)